MATIEIPHDPNMTLRCLYARFQDAFEGKYEVYVSSISSRFFVVRQSAFAGVAVWLEQNGSQTLVRYRRFAPSSIFHRFSKRLPRGFFAGRVIADVGAYVMSLRPQPL